MKKKKITYGVYGLIEWHTQLSLGKARVKASFTGGSLTTQGIVPATLMTDDPVVQMAIEKSLAYRTGKIRKVRERQTNEEISVGRNLSKPVTVSEQKTQTSDPEEDAGKAGKEESESQEITESLEEDVETDVSASQGEAATEMSPTRRDAAPTDVSPAKEESAATEMSPTQEDIAMAEECKEDQASEEDANSMEPMVFNCNDDAKDFFEEKYGVVRNKMRTRADIMNVARSLGVSIMFA